MTTYSLKLKKIYKNTILQKKHTPLSIFKDFEIKKQNKQKFNSLPIKIKSK